MLDGRTAGKANIIVFAVIPIEAAARVDAGSTTRGKKDFSPFSFLSSPTFFWRSDCNSSDSPLLASVPPSKYSTSWSSVDSSPSCPHKTKARGGILAHVISRESIIVPEESIAGLEIIQKHGIACGTSLLVRFIFTNPGFKNGNGQKRELPVLFGQNRMYPENNSGRECRWPYLIGQHPLSPVFGQKRPGTPGNSHFAQLPPVFGHLMFRLWPFYVPFLAIYVSFRWATRVLEQINMGQKNN